MVQELDRRNLKDSGLVSKINNSHILEILEREGPLSRAELARQTGLSRPMITYLTKKLLEENLIEAVGEGAVSPRGGRRPVYLRIVKGDNGIIGLDIGGFEIKAVLTDMGGHIFAAESELTQVNGSKEDVLNQIIRLVKKLEQEARKKQLVLRGIGVGFSGIIAQDGETIEVAANLPMLAGVNICNHLRENIKQDLPISMAGSGNCGVLAEKHLGGVKPDANLLFFLYGTGICVSVSFGERAIRGSKRNIFDFGHITIEKNGKLCTCGNRGCLEAYAGSKAIKEQAHQFAKQNPTSHLAQILEGMENEGCKPIIEAAEAGDEDALRIITSAARLVGEHLKDFVCFFSPDMIIFSGGLLVTNQVVPQAIQKSLQAGMNDDQYGKIEIRIAKFGKFAAALGATRLVTRQIFGTPLLEILSI